MICLGELIMHFGNVVVDRPILMHENAEAHSGLIELLPNRVKRLPLPLPPAGGVRGGSERSAPCTGPPPAPPASGRGEERPLCGFVSLCGIVGSSLARPSTTCGGPPPPEGEDLRIAAATPRPLRRTGSAAQPRQPELQPLAQDLFVLSLSKDRSSSLGLRET